MATPGPNGSWDFAESTAEVAPVGITRVARRAGTLQQSTDGNPYEGISIGAPGYLASNYGIKPENEDNGPAMTALLETLRASGRGGRVYLESAPYSDQTGFADDSDGTPGDSTAVEIIGAGRGGTYWQADGALLTSGDLITLEKSRYFHMFDMTLGATAQRSGGTFVKCIGDMQIGDVPSKNMYNAVFQHVDMENGFDGVTLENGIGDLGVCGFWWFGPSIARNFAADGTVIDCNTKNGVIINFDLLTHQETAGVAAASRPYATMRIRGASDMRCFRIESVYARNGCVVDPPASGIVNTLWMDSCIFGSVAATGTCVLIQPNATASCRLHKWNNCWVDSGDGFIVSGAAASDIQVIGLTGIVGGTFMQVHAASRVIARGCNVGGGWTRGFIASGNASDFSFDGVFGNYSGNNGTGWEVQAGSTRFSIHAIGAATYCTTPFVDNSGAVPKSIVTL